MQKGVCFNFLPLLILVLLLPGMVISFPGNASAQGFGNHGMVETDSSLEHLGHTHAAHAWATEHEHHDPSTHSHETPDRQDPSSLILPLILMSSHPDEQVTRPVRLPDRLDRPPKTST